MVSSDVISGHRCHGCAHIGAEPQVGLGKMSIPHFLRINIPIRQNLSKIVIGMLILPHRNSEIDCITGLPINLKTLSGVDVVMSNVNSKRCHSPFGFMG